MAFKFYLIAAISTLLASLVLAGPARDLRRNPLFNRDWAANSPTRTLTTGRRMTNAEKLSRGLPLNPPVIGRGAPRATTSPLPVIKYTGIVRATNASGTLGYFERDFGWAGQLALTHNNEEAVTVEVEYDGTSVLNLRPLNGNYGSFMYLGGIAESDRRELRIGSSNYTILGGVSETPAYSPPLELSNSYSLPTENAQFVESAIWGFNPQSYELTLQWVNPDGSKPPTLLTYGAWIDFLFLTGDLEQFESIHKHGGPVTLTLIPPHDS